MLITIPLNYYGSGGLFSVINLLNDSCLCKITSDKKTSHFINVLDFFNKICYNKTVF